MQLRRTCQLTASAVDLPEIQRYPRHSPLCLGPGSRHLNNINRPRSTSSPSLRAYAMSQVHELKYDDIPSITQTHKQLTDTFSEGKTLPLPFRRQQLFQVALLIQQNQELILQAIQDDLGRHKLEVYLELGPIVTSAIGAARALDQWTAPEKPDVEEWRKNWKTTIHKVPKGAVAIISPWNFPWVITFGPLVGAIAAGCTVVIKPSEQAPKCALLMKDLVSKYLDNSAYRVVLGATEETQHLLTLQWNHIFYTGSTRVGRIVAQAAGKNLIPLTLELGGQSPVYVDGNNLDLELAARRILWGRQLNSGQVCVAPNHVFVDSKYKDALVNAFDKATKAFYPDGPLHEKSSLGRILNETNLRRIQGLLQGNSGVIIGGQTKDSRLEPTFIDGASPSDPVMKNEIFGPILPIIAVNDVDEAIKEIRKRATPLVIYVFTNDDDVKNKFIQRTQSGSLVFNETFGQLAVHEIPFGGLGDSGYGASHGKFSFDTFTHLRGSIDVPLNAATDTAMAGRYPPYSDQALEFFKSVVDNVPQADAF